MWHDFVAWFVTGLGLGLGGLIPALVFARFRDRE
jgi:hypothetical protein